MGRLCIATLLIVVLLTSSIVMGCDVAGQLLAEGNELYEQGRLDEAIDKYTEAIRRGGGSEEHYHRRGIAYCDLGQTEHGIQDFNEAIRIEPDWGDPYYSRGVAYAELGKKAKAIADFEKFISLDDIDNTDWIELAKEQIKELSR